MKKTINHPCNNCLHNNNGYCERIDDDITEMVAVSCTGFENKVVQKPQPQEAWEMRVDEIIRKREDAYWGRPGSNEEDYLKSSLEDQIKSFIRTLLETQKQKIVEEIIKKLPEELNFVEDHLNYGDTDFDSNSVRYGWNSAIQEVDEIIKRLTPNS